MCVCVCVCACVRARACLVTVRDGRADELERLALQYLGTLPASETASETVQSFERDAAAIAASQVCAYSMLHIE